MSLSEDKKRWNLSTRYGLRPEDVEKMFSDQGGLCAICRNPMKRVCIDHDHDTGDVRGLLCHGCNIKLPAVENIEFCIAAAEYLDRAAMRDSRIPVLNWIGKRIQMVSEILK